MQKVACTRCGTLILPATAQKTGGLCRPCSTGKREAIEQSKAHYQKERELDHSDPERLFWKALVARVHGTGGFDALRAPEKKYFAAHVLLGEVYNGGFEQFFYNHSGEYLTVVSQTLLELGALRCLGLLRQAREVLFAKDDVPLYTPDRRRYLATHPIKERQVLEVLDKEFWSDPDALHEKLSAYGREHRLFGVA